MDIFDARSEWVRVGRGIQGQCGRSVWEATLTQCNARRAGYSPCRGRECQIAQISTRAYREARLDVVR
jgi:hypothetical protein